jgi:hypothetical protein
MKSEFNVELNNNKISDYENLLSRFSNWKKYKREINLNQLLESDKKIEFEVDIPNSQSVFYVNISTDIMNTSGACAVINKLTFIILENNVIDLKVSITALNTTFGNILRNLLDSNIDLKLYQNTHIKVGQVIDFYFELPKKAA